MMTKSTPRASNLTLPSGGFPAPRSNTTKLNTNPIRKRTRPSHSVPRPAAVALAQVTDAEPAKEKLLSYDGQPVGRNRPPARNQFKLGKSGNPKGRPKGSKNFGLQVRALGDHKMSVIENGKRRKLPVTEILLRKLRDQALNGDKQSMKVLFELLQKYSAANDEQVDHAQNSPEEIEFLKNLFGLKKDDQSEGSGAEPS